MNNTVLLIKVESGDNNNKFYQMEDLGNGNFKASWGRIGTDGQNKTYPINDWNSKYKEKIRKGYDDMSGISSTETKQKHKDLDNVAIKNFIDNLSKYSKKVIADQYLVGSNGITQKQLDKAQDLITKLQNKIKIGTKIEEFNELLLELYKTIPRKMVNVRDNLFKSKHDVFLDGKGHISFATVMIQNELDLLNTLKTQVKSDTVVNIDKTILDVLGIEMFECSKDEIIEVKKLMGGESKRFIRCFKVKNKNTNEKYESYKKEMIDGTSNEGLYWHGSRNENWLSIMETGLKIKPAGVVHTGSMFGNGIYFAPLFKKSLGYTSLSGSYRSNGKENVGYLSLFRVNKGKQLNVYEHHNWCSNFDNKECQKKQVDSLYAYAGKSLYNDELIVYNDGQCDIQYIVEIN